MTTPMTTRSPWLGAADGKELAAAERAAQAVADELAADALERDRANRTPRREAEILKRSGLVDLIIPAEHGGGGGHWASALLAVRTIARVDSSIAQVLAYHYLNLASVGFSIPDDEARRSRWFRASAEGSWIWGDAVNHTDPDLSLRPLEGGGWLLEGTKRYATGSAVGDALLVHARVAAGPAEGKVLALVLEQGRDGVEYLDDWDVLGQRLSSSNSVSFRGVRVAENDVLGPVTDEPFSTLLTPGLQLAFGHLYLGIAEGALAAAREIITKRRGSWFRSPAERYRNDPFVLRLVGELDARNAAVAALAERLAARFDEVVALGSGVTAEARGEFAVAVARLKVASSEAATDLAHRVFEATGSSSTASSHGLDRYWRNIRTHSLHDPVDYKKLEVGDFYLNGTPPPPTLYT